MTERPAKCLCGHDFYDHEKPDVTRDGEYQVPGCNCKAWHSQPDASPTPGLKPEQTEVINSILNAKGDYYTERGDAPTPARTITRWDWDEEKQYHKVTPNGEWVRFVDVAKVERDERTLKDERAKFRVLVTYFEKRAAENQKRMDRPVPADRTADWHAGKADTYKRCADKLRQLLG